MLLHLSSAALMGPLGQTWCEKNTSSCVTLASLSPRALAQEKHCHMKLKFTHSYFHIYLTVYKMHDLVMIELVQDQLLWQELTSNGHLLSCAFHFRSWCRHPEIGYLICSDCNIYCNIVVQLEMWSNYLGGKNMPWVLYFGVWNPCHAECYHIVQTLCTYSTVIIVLTVLCFAPSVGFLELFKWLKCWRRTFLKRVTKRISEANNNK